MVCTPHQRVPKAFNRYTRAMYRVNLKTFNCYSEFHASTEAIVRRMPIEDVRLHVKFIDKQITINLEF